MNYVKQPVLLLIVLISFIPSFSFGEQWSDPQFLSGLNTEARDLETFVTADGKTLYFSSDRHDHIDLKENLDIYVSHLIDGQWSEAERIPEPISVEGYWDGHPSLTLDGRYMYFHSSRPGTYGSRDIWVAENINGVWQEPVNLGPNINSDAIDYNPSISVDGQSLMFASDRSGGHGNKDLYIARKIDGVWQPAENMGPNINSNFDDSHPSFSYTGKYVFFASMRYNRPYDVYRSEKINGAYQAPVNVGPPINTEKDNIPAFFLDCSDTLYISSIVDYGDKFNWDIGVSSWLDPPHDNPCDNLIIPEGQWRVRVTLLKASAELRNDLYIDQPISMLLIRNSLKNVGAVVSTPFLEAEELVFYIHVKGQPYGLGEYDHYSNSEFASVERIDPLRYIVGFEDLPADMADWDYDDTVLLVELIGTEVNIWEDQNFLGENQIIGETPIDFVSRLDLDLSYGAAIHATADIDGHGLDDTTFSALIEGDPDLYADLLVDVPFTEPENFLKLELLNGQTSVPDNASIKLQVDLDSDYVSKRKNNSKLRLFRFNEDTHTWHKLYGQSFSSRKTLEASVSSVGLFVLATSIDDDSEDDSLLNSSDGGDSDVVCGQLGGHIPSRPVILSFLSILFLPLFAAFALRLRKKTHRL